MHSHSELELRAFDRGYVRIAGVDEAGRGPLAGPVVAAAVIFRNGIEVEGIADSKKLTHDARIVLAESIRRQASAWAIGVADHAEIDSINILQASILAMHRAIEGLKDQPDYLLIDGNRFHHPSMPFETVVKGDSKCFSIAAASILAKVTRDAMMLELHEHYPEYGFNNHKGYPTKQHIDAVKTHGYSPVHRKSFVVKQLIQTEAFEGL